MKKTLLLAFILTFATFCHGIDNFKPIKSTGVAGSTALNNFSSYRNSPVRKICLWYIASENHIISRRDVRGYVRAVEITYYDNTVFSRGVKSGSMNCREIVQNQPVTDVVFLSSNGFNQQRAGGVIFTTSGSRSKLGDGWEGAKRISNGGVIIGIWGSSGSDIDTLGFYYRDALKSVLIENVRYTLPKFSEIKMSPIQLTTQSIDNPTGLLQTPKVLGKKTQTVTRNFSGSWALTTGVTVTAKAGIPLLLEGSVSVTASQTTTITVGVSNSVSIEFAWEQPVNVSPCRYARATVYVQSSPNQSIPFVADVIAVYQSGQRQVLNSYAGKWTGVMLSGVKFKYSPQTVIPGCVVLKGSQPVLEYDETLEQSQ